MTEAIIIRPLHTHSEFEAAVALQSVYWGTDAADLVPEHMLRSIVNYGGHLLGALDGERLVGLLLGFLGTLAPLDAPAAPRLVILSKRMVVLPEYRGQKIGERLKEQQAHIARQQGIQRVTWTFDPLLARNAYLNLHKLRAVGQAYKEDYFGPEVSNPNLRADRLVVNLWVNHQRVCDEQPPASDAAAPLLNPVSEREGLLVPPDAWTIPDAESVRLTIPAEFVPLNNFDPVLGQAWRDHVRATMQALFAQGYLITDVQRAEDRAHYVFTRDDGTFADR